MDSTGYLLLGLGLFLSAILLWWIVATRMFRRFGRLLQTAEGAIDHALGERRSAVQSLAAIAPAPFAARLASLPWPDGVPAVAAIADKAAFATLLQRLADGALASPWMKVPPATAAATRLLESAGRLDVAVQLYNAAVARATRMAMAFPLALVANAVRFEAKERFILPAPDEH